MSSYMYQVLDEEDEEDCLKSCLETIHAFDLIAKDYNLRNAFIYEALFVASGLGYKAGFRLDPEEPEWPVAFISLPTGQVSWHLPQYDEAWDGHTTEEKYERIKRFCSG